MQEHLSTLLIHPVKSIIHDLTVSQPLINGTQVLLIYYFLVLLFFFLDVYIDNNVKRDDQVQIKDLDWFHKGLAYLYSYYRKYGLITINAIILLICIGIIVFNIGFEWNFIFDMTFSILAFTIFIRIVLRLFINRRSYANESTVRLINIICYIILGNYFCYNMNFISTPNLILSLGGLTLALLFCVYIMIIAIFNPEIIQKKTVNSSSQYSQAFGILKGMIVVLICMITTLYFMTYCCYKASPHFYASTSESAFDEVDLFYYLIISFTTIGYGDIVPIRYHGMFYSRYAAILIGLSSIFTTTCFIAAVISTTNSLAKAYRDNHEDQKNKLEPDIVETKLRKILNEFYPLKSAEGNKEEVKFETEKKLEEDQKKEKERNTISEKIKSMTNKVKNI